jgi:hypothetical protein
MRESLGSRTDCGLFVIEDDEVDLDGGIFFFLPLSTTTFSVVLVFTVLTLQTEEAGVEVGALREVVDKGVIVIDGVVPTPVKCISAGPLVANSESFFFFTNFARFSRACWLRSWFFFLSASTFFAASGSTAIAGGVGMLVEVGIADVLVGVLAGIGTETGMVEGGFAVLGGLDEGLGTF